MKTFKDYLDESCWSCYKPVPGKKPYSKGSCTKEELEELFDILEEVVDDMAEQTESDPDAIWEELEDVSDEELFETAAWRRKEGKSPTGGLNAKGIASYRREHPGSKLSMAVTTEPSKLDPDSKAAKRRKSFCARMGGMKGPMKDEKGRPTRKALSLRKWNCEEENKYPVSAERGIYETSIGKKIKYGVKSFLQMNRIGKELGQDAVKDKTYQKREKGMKRLMKEGHIGFGTWGKMGDGFQYSRKNTYGTKPKEKPESNEPGTGDTYKGSKQGGTNVKRVKPVRESQIDELKDKQVLMFCSGGIRCERASAYVKEKGISKEVYQIEGGIHRYIEQFPNGHFKGTYYVFDGRVGVKVSDDILTNCDLCATPCDFYVNCMNGRCNKQFIGCTSCIDQYKECCSTTCQKLVETAQVPLRKKPVITVDQRLELLEVQQ